MALPEVPECIGATFNCSATTPECFNSARFDFETLWTITQQYSKQCSSGPWIFKQAGTIGPVPEGTEALTNAACEAIAGSDWKRYSDNLIWYRLATWKFPLFQLIFNSPKPPLGPLIGAFSIAHLLGDPCGTFTDLVQKWDICQDRAEYWEHALEKVKLRPHRYDAAWEDVRYRKRLGKALALIAISYDEWGTDLGDFIQMWLEEQLTTLCSESASKVDRDKFIDQCLQTASLLAADRSTKSLPVIIAQTFLIGSVIIAIIRTGSASKDPGPSTYINIETYSIGYTALYFWVISVVTLASVIGTSQTANAIPNILSHFRWSLCNAFPTREINLPKTFNAEERYRRGGIYSWQPEKAPDHFFKNAAVRLHRFQSSTIPLSRRRSSIHQKVHQSWPWFCTVLPFVSVSFGTVIGMVLTSLVPPVGWSCRTYSQSMVFVAWVISYAAGFIRWGRHHRCRFWFTFAKDILTMATGLGIVLATQIGIHNSCSCYTGNGAVGLALPQIPVIKQMLESRLETSYMGLTVAGIVAQLVVFPGAVMWRYSAAAKVFLQRDDGESNLQWLYDTCSWTWWKAQWLAIQTWHRRKGSKVEVDEEGDEHFHWNGTIISSMYDRQDGSQKSQASFMHVEEAIAGHRCESPVQSLEILQQPGSTMVFNP